MSELAPGVTAITPRFHCLLRKCPRNQANGSDLTLGRTSLFCKRITILKLERVGIDGKPLWPNSQLNSPTSMMPQVGTAVLRTLLDIDLETKTIKKHLPASHQQQHREPAPLASPAGQATCPELCSGLAHTS